MSVRGVAAMPISEAKKRANEKWNKENTELIALRYNKKDFTREQLNSAAEREGFRSANAWIIDLVKKNL